MIGLFHRTRLGTDKHFSDSSAVRTKRRHLLIAGAGWMTNRNIIQNIWLSPVAHRSGYCPSEPTVVNGLPCSWLYRNRIRLCMSKGIEGLLSVATWSPPRIQEMLFLLPGSLHFYGVSTVQNYHQAGLEDSVKRSKDWYLHIWVNLFISTPPGISGVFQV